MTDPTELASYSWDLEQYPLAVTIWFMFCLDVSIINLVYSADSKTSFGERWIIRDTWEKREGAF